MTTQSTSEASGNSAGSEPMSDGDKIATVHAILEAWSAKDWDRVVSLFAPNGRLQSVMSEPIVGREAFAERLKILAVGLERFTYRMKAIGVIDGRVFVERVEEIAKHGNYGEVPVVSVLSVEEGLVTEWTEYFDKATMLSAVSGPPDQASA